MFDEAKLAWVNRHYLKTIDAGPADDAGAGRTCRRRAGHRRGLGARRGPGSPVSLPPLAASIDRLTELPERMHLVFAFDAALALARADVRAEAQQPAARR